MKLHLPLLLRAAVLACVAASSFGTTAQGGTMHLYVLTGQSNSLGAVKGSPATPGQLEQYASTGQLWNGNMNKSTGDFFDTQPAWVTVAPQLPRYGNLCMGPEYGFSHMMLRKGWIDSAAGDGLGVIKTSLDGGSNKYWLKYANEEDKEADRMTPTYSSILSSVKNAIDAMQASGTYDRISLEGLMYLQGESNNADEAAIAKDRYTEFLSNLKADLEAARYDSSLLVQSVLGEPATWNGTDDTNTVEQLKELADERADIGWVRTRDLTKITSGDNKGVHYDGKSQITIGARYAYAMALQLGKDVGDVRNDNYTAGVSLNDGAAWWSGTAPTATDVAVWDVSSANVADTLSGDLALQGLVVEDPFRSRISISAASGATPTLSLGSSGITLQKAGLDIGVNLATTADQTWQVAGGQSLSIGSSDHAVALEGGHVISLRTQGEGAATISLHTQGSASRWDVGTGVNLFLSGSHDSVQLADSATASLGSSDGGSPELAALTLGDNSTLHIGGEGAAGNLGINHLTLGSGCVLGMDILSNSTYDSLSLSQITGDNVTFRFHYGTFLLPNKAFTIVQGWGNTTDGITFNEDAGGGRTAALSVVNGDLVLTLLGEPPVDYTQPWVEPAEGTPAQTITANGVYNATAAVASNPVKSTLTNAKTATEAVYFYANNVNNSSGDYYGELQNVSVTWFAAYGSGSRSNVPTMTGNAYAKLSGADDEVAIKAVCGAINGNVASQQGVEGSGNVYVELDNPNATYEGDDPNIKGYSIMGVNNANVNGSVTIVIKGGKVSSAVVGGCVYGNHTIGNGTYLQLEEGKYAGKIIGGNAVASTINGGSHIYITGGTFKGMVAAGNEASGSVINGGASMAIYGGTFEHYVVAGGFTGTVNGGVELTIAGGNFSAMNTTKGIYAGGGASSSVITGGTSTTLLGIGDDNGFASYTGILSGGNTASGASLSGTKALKLQGYTAAQVNARLQDFDAITVTQRSSTKINSSNNSTLGDATALNVEGTSALELAAGSDAWDLGTVTATVEADSTLKKSGAGQLTLNALSGAGTFEATEGTSTLNSVAGFTGTVKVAAGATAQITAAAGNLGTLTGSGLVEMTGSGGDTSTAFTMTEGEWTGTVKFNAERTNMANIDLARYGVKGSTIAFQGAGTSASGYSDLKENHPAVQSNFLLEADDNGIGLKFTAGWSPTTLTFEGAWSGNGKFLFDQYNTQVTETFAFVNDLTGFTGGIEANTPLSLKFGNGAIVGSAVGSATGTGDINGSGEDKTGSKGDRTLKVFINYQGDTNSENSFKGNLDLTKEGAATHSLKAANTYTGTTTISGGTLALQEDGSLGSGAVSIATAADGLALGDTLVASAEGSSNGAISGHHAITATTLAGTESRHATLDNLTLTVRAASTRAAAGGVELQYADMRNTSIMAGRGASMTLENVSFDAASSARLAEGADSCNITATNVSIDLNEDEFSLSPESGESNILELTSTRFNALGFSGTLALSDTGNYLAGLLEDNRDLHKIIISFDGADMGRVTDVQLDLPDEVSPYTFIKTENSLVLTKELEGAKWTSQDALWSDDAADWNQGGAPNASQAANLTGLGNSAIRLEGNKEAQALNVNAYDATETTGTRSYTLQGDALTVGSMHVAYGSLEIQNAVTVEEREDADGIWTGAVTIGADGELTVDTDASLTAAEMTISQDGGGRFTNEGDTEISGRLTAGDIVNNGSLSIGSGSDVGSVSGTGSLETHGNNVSLGSLGNSTLSIVDGETTLKAAATTLAEGASLTGEGTLRIAPAPGESGSLLLEQGVTLDIGGLSVASLTLQGNGSLGSIGFLETDSLTLSGTTLADLETGDGALAVTSLSALAEGGTVTLSLDSLDLEGMVLDASYTVFSGGGASAEEITLSSTMRQAAKRLGRALSLSASECGDLLLTASVLPEDVWFTDETTTAQGTPVSGYTALDEVGEVHIAGTDGHIDLGPASLDDATDPTLGLTVKNLQGEDKNGVLVLSGGADDLVTLMNAADTETAGTLVLDGLRANTATRDGGSHGLSIAAVELRNNAELHAEDGKIDLSLGQLNGASGTVSGDIRITGQGGNYSGQYGEGNARIVLEENAVQTLAPREGLNLKAKAGSTAILAEAAKGTEMESLTAEAGSIVDLGEAAAGDAGLTLHNGEGNNIAGNVRFRMAAGDAGVVAIAGNNVTYAPGSSITIAQKEADGSMVMATVPTATTGIRLAQVGADSNSTATVTLSGSLFRKYYSNARLSGNAIVVDRNARYASGIVTPDSPNGHAGAALLDDLLVTLNPQANPAAHPDLAALMDAVDRGQIGDTQAAAVAGASLAAMGSAFMGDVERQLRAIRNRTTTMGLDQGQEHEGLPYLNAWVNAEGDYRKMEQDGTAAGYTLSSWGGTIGFDLDVTPSLVAGFAVTAMYGDMDAKAPDCAEGDFDSYYVTLFARYAARSWTHTFIGSLGRADVSLDRTVGYGAGSYKATGDTDGFGFGLMYETGYVAPLDEDATTCLQPVFNVSWRHIGINGYTEHGTDAALHAGDQEMDVVTFGLGARLQSALPENVYNRTALFEARALLKADAGDRRSELCASLGQATKAVGIESAKAGACGIELGAGLTIPVGAEGGALFLDGSAEWRQGYTNLNGTVGYRINF